MMQYEVDYLTVFKILSIPNDYSNTGYLK